MNEPDTFSDIVVLVVMGLTAIAIVWTVMWNRSRGGVERVKQAELERDQARSRADELQARVDRLEERLDRRLHRQLDHEEFDQRLEG